MVRARSASHGGELVEIRKERAQRVAERVVQQKRGRRVGGGWRAREIERARGRRRDAARRRETEDVGEGSETGRASGTNERGREQQESEAAA